MSSGDDFVSHLLSAMPTPESRLRLAAALVRFEGCTIYLARQSGAARRRQAARRMLGNGMSACEAVRVLRERYGVTARTAQRDVSYSRKMSPSSVASSAQS